MLTTKIDISGRFINCQLGSICHFFCQSKYCNQTIHQADNDNSGLRDTQHGKST